MPMAGKLGYPIDSKLTHGHHHPPPIFFFNAMILMIIARRTMKHFFLTIHFYAPSYPPFDFLFLFNAKRHSKAKKLKSSRNPFTGTLVALCYLVFPSIHFNIRRSESKKKQKTKSRGKAPLKKNLLAFTVSLCF